MHASVDKTTVDIACSCVDPRRGFGIASSVSRHSKSEGSPDGVLAANVHEAMPGIHDKPQLLLQSGPNGQQSFARVRTTTGRESGSSLRTDQGAAPPGSCWPGRRLQRMRKVRCLSDASVVLTPSTYKQDERYDTALITPCEDSLYYHCWAQASRLSLRSDGTTRRQIATRFMPISLLRRRMSSCRPFLVDRESP